MKSTYQYWGNFVTYKSNGELYIPETNDPDCRCSKCDQQTETPKVPSQQGLTITCQCA